MLVNLRNVDFSLFFYFSWCQFNITSLTNLEKDYIICVWKLNLVKDKCFKNKI